MFESRSLTRLNDALHAVVELGPTLREMVDEIRTMHEVMTETNRALGEVSAAMDHMRDQLETMSHDITAAAQVIERAHEGLEAAARSQGA